MKTFAKCIGVLVTLLFLSGSALAWNNADRISLAANGKGDLLFYKYYLAAANGWETKISVTNTSLTASVVAKVVIRSYKNSTELLDFLIYLSPSDVWTAKLYQSGTATHIYSEDSSCRNAASQWASADAPLDYALKTIGTEAMAFCSNDSTSMGYIYIVQSAFATGAGQAVTTANFGKVGVSKADMATEYAAGVAGNASAFDVWNGTAPTPWNNSLAGYELFFNRVLGMWSSAIQAVTLRDYKSMTFLGTGQTNRLGTLGEANNNLAEIEAALAKANISLPYVEATDKATVHIIGFPTKYTTSSTCVLPFTYAGPFFDATIGNHTNSDGTITLSGVQVFDVNENTSAPEPFSPSPTAGGLRNEVNIFAVSALNAEGFPEGWVYYPFSYTALSTTNQSGQTLTYTGIPALTAVIFFGDYDSYAIDGAWDDATVSINGVVYPFYQASSSSTVTN